MCELVEATGTVSHLCWFADVPNDLPKLVPYLREKNPSLLLTLSKNNRSGKYVPEELHVRMLNAGAEWLVEFTEGDNCIQASLMTGAGRYALKNEMAISTLASSMVTEFLRLQHLCPPLNLTLSPTADSSSFLKHDRETETGVPLLTHPGAFGVTRRNHIHEGVDLYVREGEPVYAMEEGVVVYHGWFTGQPVGSPWWNDTECILVQGESGGLNYGELRVAPGLARGVPVRKGQLLGHVAAVLQKDKGRPRAMLHLERYTHDIAEPVIKENDLKEYSDGKYAPPYSTSPLPRAARSGQRSSLGNME